MTSGNSIEWFFSSLYLSNGFNVFYSDKDPQKTVCLDERPLYRESIRRGSATGFTRLTSNSRMTLVYAAGLNHLSGDEVYCSLERDECMKCVG